MFLWISSNSCSLKTLLVRSHLAEIIIAKRIIQGRNNVTRVRVEPGSCNQGCSKNDVFTLSATLPTLLIFSVICSKILFWLKVIFFLSIMIIEIVFEQINHGNIKKGPESSTDYIPKSCTLLRIWLVLSSIIFILSLALFKNFS